MGNTRAVSELKECWVSQGNMAWSVESSSHLDKSVRRPRDVAPADRHEGGTLAGTCVLALGIVSSELEA
jgi:hypothetical protein